jgi:hypothetical protein
VQPGPCDCLLIIPKCVHNCYFTRKLEHLATLRHTRGHRATIGPPGHGLWAVHANLTGLSFDEEHGTAICHEFAFPHGRSVNNYVNMEDSTYHLRTKKILLKCPIYRGTRHIRSM